MTQPDDGPELEGPFVVPVEDSIDLHTFSPKEVKALVEEYLYQCHARKFKEVRIIHGRGTGILRHAVQHALEKSALVERFYDAPPERGGWGATVVLLK
jgi:DNA-nicking Smr family endonuclease